jgi:hypothetical protein
MQKKPLAQAIQSFEQGISEDKDSVAKRSRFEPSLPISKLTDDSSWATFAAP